MDCCIYVGKMHKTSHVFVLCLLLPSSILYTISQETFDEIKLSQNVEHCQNLNSFIRCPNDKRLEREPKFIYLKNIESNEGTKLGNSTLKNSDILFFIESSGRNHLRPRDACAIESAVKNSGMSGRIIIAMTSPSIDVFANNATCQIYTKFGERAVFFRHVNIDTIFQSTSLHELHVKGLLRHNEKKNTIVQYRYSTVHIIFFYFNLLEIRFYVYVFYK